MFSSRAITFLLTFFSLSVFSVAADSTLQHLYPVAGQLGTTVSVTAAGKFEPWPPQVWVDGPGITFKALKESGKFEVEIAKDAVPGPHLIRFFNEQSATAPDFFIVSSEADLLEKEPNNDFKLPQEITSFPVTIGGRLDPAGDVDSFAVTLKRGETLKASVEGYVLASPFDGLLRIVDHAGSQFAFNHDGDTLDPSLVWTVPQDGIFIVQFMGFAHPATSAAPLTGSSSCVYRLHLSRGPLPYIIFPKHEITQGPALSEQEPNDSRTNAQTVAIPCTVSGCIQKPLDEDRFAFTAIKGRAYELRVIAESAGSPLEAWLKIENGEGKELARNKDEGSRDPRLVWTAPGDGVFMAALGDLPHHGGNNFVYRLCLEEAAPSVSANALAHFVTVAPGKTSEIKVTVKRNNGFKAKLQLAARGLPEGVSAPEVEVSDKAGEVVLKLVAEAGARPASQPFSLVLRETDNGSEHPVIYPMTSTLQDNGVKNGFSDLVIESTTQLWLSVPPEAPKPDAPKKELPPAEIKK